jgi:transcriptional regulator with XRE-family HTH domain
VEKEAAEETEPQRDEVLVLLELLDKEILSGDRSKRKLERDLGVGQGYLGSLLRGRITLKVEHLWDLGEVMGFEPLVLLFRSAPKEHQERFLRELGLRQEASAAASEPARSMTREEIEELVRKIVRQELARMATS